MEQITTIEQALEIIEQVGETPKGVEVRISFRTINWEEVEQFAKQEGLELHQRGDMKGYFHWVDKNCFTFWNN